MQHYRAMLDLSGQGALVVGAASGIGRASAEALAAFGARVLLADRDEGGLEAALKAIRGAGGEAEAMVLDVTASEAGERAVEAIQKRFGRLDVLVSTPAINVRKPLLEYTDEEVDRVVDLNLKATLRLLRAGGRAMREGGGGSLIALASIRALVVEPGQGVYAATKAGILQIVRTLAAELGPYGVRANAVAPGPIETPSPPPSRPTPSGTGPTRRRPPSCAGAGPRRWPWPWSSWPPLPRATSPGPFSWWTAAGRRWTAASPRPYREESVERALLAAEAVEEKEVVDLLRALVRIPSHYPGPGEEGVVDFLEAFLKERGLQAFRQEAAPEGPTWWRTWGRGKEGSSWRGTRTWSSPGTRPSGATRPTVGWWKGKGSTAGGPAT